MIAFTGPSPLVGLSSELVDPAHLVNISMSDEAKRLKDGGNAFFIKKDYIRAASLYSEAILLDENNAILYANRAACRLALGE
jgi:hypothetical protein